MNGALVVYADIVRSAQSYGRCCVCCSMESVEHVFCSCSMLELLGVLGARKWFLGYFCGICCVCGGFLDA